MTCRPPPAFCPECGDVMPAQSSYVAADAPDACDYDHYYCQSCDECYDIGDFVDVHDKEGEP